MESGRRFLVLVYERKQHMKVNSMKTLGLLGLVFILTACAGHERREDRREDRRSEAQPTQPATSMSSATQIALPNRAV